MKRGVLSCFLLCLLFPPAPAFAFLKKKNIRGEVLDIPTYESLTHVIIVSGATKFTGAQEKILHGLEEGWKNCRCWQIMDHLTARKKLRHGLVPPPSLRKWGASPALERVVLRRIPQRDPGMGILIFWVTDWTGERTRAATPIKDLVDGFLEKQRKKEGFYTPPAPGPRYGRKAVAQLFDSKTGKELWRAYKSYWGILLAKDNKLFVASHNYREEQREQEFEDFIDFFYTALTYPQNMQSVCPPKSDFFFHSVRLKKAASYMDKLIKKLQSNNYEERASAAKALGERGSKKAVEPLILTLKDKNLKVRGRAIDALGSIGDERAVDPLIGVLEDKSKYIRALAARALGKIGNLRAKVPLKKLKKDKEELVRKEAEIALKEVKRNDFSLDMDMNFNFPKMEFDEKSP